jgi:Protein of unknown function (DUF2568)
VAVKSVLLAVRFGLEIAALVALAYWGFTIDASTSIQVILGIGAPLLAAVVWGLFVSPKARFGSPGRQALFEALVFGGAVLALVHAGRTVPALAFAAVAVVDSVLVRVVDLSPS